MKFYNLNTEFMFGKFKGKTLKEVTDAQITYLNWCSVNLEHFYLADDVISQIKELNPTFELSDEAKNSLNAKFQNWKAKQIQKNTPYVSNDDLIDWSNYNDDLDMDQQSPDFWNQF